MCAARGAVREYPLRLSGRNIIELELHEPPPVVHRGRYFDLGVGRAIGEAERPVEAVCGGHEGGGVEEQSVEAQVPGIVEEAAHDVLAELEPARPRADIDAFDLADRRAEATHAAHGDGLGVEFDEVKRPGGRGEADLFDGSLDVGPDWHADERLGRETELALDAVGDPLDILDVELDEGRAVVLEVCGNEADVGHGRTSILGHAASALAAAIDT